MRVRVDLFLVSILVLFLELACIRWFPAHVLFLSFFTILFTKKNPFVGFQAMILRYQWRTFSYALFMRDEYPPFDFATDADRITADPAVMAVAEPGEMNRWLVFVKWPG